MMEIRAIDPLTDARWTPFLDNAGGATIFHHPAWLSALMEAYGYRSASLGCFDGDTLVGVLPLLEIRSRLTGVRGVALPFSDYGGPVTDRHDAGTLLLDAALAAGRERGWKFVEVRGPLAHPDARQSAAFKRHQLVLGADAVALRKGFDKGQNLRSLTKFERSGATVERSADREALRAFMRLNYRTRRKHGLPPQPDRFFDALQRSVLDRGMGYVSVARLAGQDLAACVFLTYRDTVYYKFGASDEAGLSHRPNHGIMWDAMQWSIARGYRVLDFGRSDLDGEGLIKFKRGWGTVETDLAYARIGTAGPVAGGSGGGILERAKPVLERLPIPVLKLIGRVLYEHVG